MKKNTFLKNMIAAATCVAVMAVFFSCSSKDDPLGLTATSVELNKNALTLLVGDTHTLIAYTVSETVTWSSTDANIASVDINGKVTAKAIGTVNITAKVGDQIATCEVTVVSSSSFTDFTQTVSGISFDMVAVGKGIFTMGAANTDTQASNNEKPAHSVTLTINFYIGKTEVTQALWKAVMGNNPSYYQSSTYPAWGDDLQRPIEQVSSNEIIGTDESAEGYTENGVTYYKNGFCYKLSVLANGGTLGTKHYRLPTEAEWEFSARGGNKSQGYKYSGSNNIDVVAWYYENCQITQPVGTKAANELGIYDMTGSVSEWCSDWFDDYTANAQTDPQGPSFGFDDSRVKRGGNLNSPVGYCRLTCRGYGSLYTKSTSLGFRLAINLFQ